MEHHHLSTRHEQRQACLSDDKTKDSPRHSLEALESAWQKLDLQVAAIAKEPMHIDYDALRAEATRRHKARQDSFLSLLFLLFSLGSSCWLLFHWNSYVLDNADGLLFGALSLFLLGASLGCGVRLSRHKPLPHFSPIRFCISCALVIILVVPPYEGRNSSSPTNSQSAIESIDNILRQL